MNEQTLGDLLDSGLVNAKVKSELRKINAPAHWEYACGIIFESDKVILNGKQKHSLTLYVGVDHIFIDQTFNTREEARLTANLIAKKLERRIRALIAVTISERE